MQGDKATATAADNARGSIGQRARALLPRLRTPLLLLLTAGLTALLVNALTPEPDMLTAPEVDELVGQALASATPRTAFSSQVYRAIYPSLVLIQTEGERSGEEDNHGLGSGVVINAAGDILTALHVVEKAAQIEVAFTDGTRAQATLIASQPDIDIAVLRSSQPPEVIVPAVLGSLSSVRVGDEAYAVGNPFGLPGSLSAGVISGFDRSLTLSETDQRISGMIQFDAAVNPGNSGGPLLNRNGQVIGIVTGLANPDEQRFFIGIGLAVPITAAAGAAGAPPY